MIALSLRFDILAVPEASDWGSDGPESYLLRPEIGSPISVDRLICPSIFQPEFLSADDVRLASTHRSIE